MFIRFVAPHVHRLQPNRLRVDQPRHARADQNRHDHPNGGGSADEAALQHGCAGALRLRVCVSSQRRQRGGARFADKFDADSKIKLFESQHIRSEWDAEAEKWWFSVQDVVAVLTDQPDYKKVRNYWKWLKNKLIAEGSQLVSATNQLKRLKTPTPARSKTPAPRAWARGPRWLCGAGSGQSAR